MYKRLKQKINELNNNNNNKINKQINNRMYREAKAARFRNVPGVAVSCIGVLCVSSFLRFASMSWPVSVYTVFSDSLLKERLL